MPVFMILGIVIFVGELYSYIYWSYYLRSLVPWNWRLLLVHPKFYFRWVNDRLLKILSEHLRKECKE